MKMFSIRSPVLKILFLFSFIFIGYSSLAAASSTYPVDMTNKEYFEFDSGSTKYLIIQSQLGSNPFLTSTGSKIYSYYMSVDVYHSTDGGSTWLSDGSKGFTTTSGTLLLSNLTVSNVITTFPIYADSSKTTLIYSVNTSVLVPDTVAPVDVTNIQAVNLVKDSFTLTWDASSSSDVSSYQVFQGSTLLGSTSSTSYAVSGLSPDTDYSFLVKSVDGFNNISSGSSVFVHTLADTPAGGGDPPMEPTGLFPSLDAAGITAQATSWSANFDTLLLVVVGVGLGFAAVRFVKGLFF